MALSVVQSAQQHDQVSGTTTSKAFASNVAAGNLIVAVCGWIDITTTCSVSDSLGNSYVSAVGPTNMPSSGYRAQIFFAKNIVGGACTVTMTISATNINRRLGIAEVAGADAAAPLDVVSANTGTLSVPDSGSATTTVADEIIFGWCMSDGGNTAGTGFTEVQRIGLEEFEEKIVAVTGTYSATFTGSSGDWAAQMATFKQASAGGGASLDDGGFRLPVVAASTDIVSVW